MFIIAAIGGSIAGVYPADPISQTAHTSAGLIHSIGGILRFISLAIALPLLSAELRKFEYWLELGTRLRLLGIVFVIAFVVTIFVLAPNNLFGLGQRFFISILLIWLVSIGYPLIRKMNNISV